MSSGLHQRGPTRHLTVLGPPVEVDGEADVAAGGAATGAAARVTSGHPSTMARPGADADVTTAVVAHGLLGNLAVVRGVARLLMAEPTLDEAERARLLGMLDTQVDLMQGVLTDLIRGLPSRALAALDDLRR